MWVTHKRLDTNVILILILIGVCIPNECPDGSAGAPVLEMYISGATLELEDTECDIPPSQTYTESFVLDAEKMAQCRDDQAVEESDTLQLYCARVQNGELYN